MIKLVTLLDEVIRLLDMDVPPLIIVEIDQANLERYSPKILLTESQWKQSSYSNYFYRIDPPNPAIQTRRHVAIAHKNHLHTKNRQVSWNDDYSRHDRHSFDANFRGIEKAKDIARNVLKLPKDAQLEHATNLADKLLLLENLDSISDDAIFLVV